MDTDMTERVERLTKLNDMNDREKQIQEEIARMREERAKLQAEAARHAMCSDIKRKMQREIDSIRECLDIICWNGLDSFGVFESNLNDMQVHLSNMCELQKRYIKNRPID